MGGGAAGEALGEGLMRSLSVWVGLGGECRGAACSYPTSCKHQTQGLDCLFRQGGKALRLKVTSKSAGTLND